MVNDGAKPSATLFLKVVCPINGRNADDIAAEVRTTLEQGCGLTFIEDLRHGRAAQNDYETKLLECRAAVQCSVDADDCHIHQRPSTSRELRQEAALSLQRKWSQACRWLVPRSQDQPRLHFLDHDAFFHRCIMIHEDLICSSFSLGNLIDNGTFWDRYTCMGLSGSPPVNSPSECSVLGWPIKITFEHDKKSINIHLRDGRPPPPEAAYQSQSHPPCYRITINYRYIHHIVVDYGGTEDDPISGGSATDLSLYLRLKIPPRLYRVYPQPHKNNRRGRRPQDRNGSGSPQCDDDPLLTRSTNFARTRTIPDCPLEVFSQSPYFRIVLPKRQALQVLESQRHHDEMEEDDLLPQDGSDSLSSRRPECNGGGPMDAQGDDGITATGRPRPLFENGSDPFLRGPTQYHQNDDHSDRSEDRDFFVGSASTSDWAYGPFYEIFSRIAHRAKVPVTFGAVKSIQRKPSMFKPSADFLPSFSCMYTLCALLSRGFAVHDKLTELFLKRIQDCCAERPDATEDALGHLTSAMDEYKTLDLLEGFEHFYQAAIADGVRMDIPDNCFRIRKIVITPTRMLYVEPEVMMSNRVLRNFGHDWALRIVFRDDDMARLFRNVKVELNFYTRIIYDHMENGIEIGNRIYRFLAWSNSQLRDHGCYMWCDVAVPEFWAWRATQDQAIFRRPGENFANNLPKTVDEAPGGVITADMVRGCFGSFTKIRSIPKLMARIGQCFTQTQRVLSLKPEEVETEEDVIGGDFDEGTGRCERYTFSDGIGRISQSLAQVIAHKLELEYTPSAYQIRYAGFKGMLSVDSSLDRNQSGPKVVFRESMLKFNDTSGDLEIVKYSQPSLVTLNRPLITILDQVTERQGSIVHQRMKTTVHNLLDKQLFRMADMLLSERTSAEALKDKTPLTFEFQSMVINGFQFTQEPFFRGLLLAIHRQAVQYLFKARIDIHPSLGRTMYGVLDETGSLQYGQVFVQYSEDHNKPSEKTKIVEGPVMVTKNPCISPGDVRRFNAIKIPALESLVDCIVFPKYGPRPHTDEMAGSDLDGDEYAVFWMSEIMLEGNETPAIFPKMKPDEHRGELKVGHMIEFFRQYVSQDQIGDIATAHLVAADRFSLFHPRATEIATKHSIAVDFPKTGKPPDPLDSMERPNKFPDFLMKTSRDSYRSHRLLGQTYRKIKVIDDILALGQSEAPIEVDTDLVVDGWEDFRKEAINQRNIYNQYVQSLLDSYGIDDEWQLISGHMTRVRNRLSDNDREDFSFYNTEKIIELRIRRIWSKFRSRFFCDYPDLDDEEEIDTCNNPEVLQKASAWYVVTYDYRRFDNTRRLLSFPWIVWHVLNSIKRRAVYGRQDKLKANPVQDAFDAAIEAKWGDTRRRVPSQLGPGYFPDDETLAEIELCLEKAVDGSPVLQDYFTFYQDLQAIISCLAEWAMRQGILRQEIPGGGASGAAGPHQERSLKHQAFLRPIHVILFFLQWAAFDRRDIDEGGPNVLKQFLLKPSEIGQARKRGELRMSIFSRGELIINFLKYLASEQFRNQRNVEFDAELNNDYILRDVRPIIRLHQAAFKTYHHIALTGRFDSLYLVEREMEQTWDFDEADPIQIEWHGPALPDRTPYPLPIRRIIALFKEWTNVKDINFRHCGHGHVFVSASGSLESRQRLRQLLLREDLWDSIKKEDNPLDACEF